MRMLMYVVYISATDGVLYLPVSLLFRAVHSKSDAKIRCPVALRALPVSWVTLFFALEIMGKAGKAQNSVLTISLSSFPTFNCHFLS